jgi:bifunctional DNA-binding transcriptional regulator/antitoxin component of YhaV-PrlF toxin-antitoxin module
MAIVEHARTGVPVTVTAGRLTLPAAARQASGVPADGPLVAIPEDGQIVLMPRAEALRRARAVVREALARQGQTITDVQDDLAAHRRAEAQAEAEAEAAR